MTASQSEQENLALVRRGFDAFAAGDMPTLTELLAIGAVWNTVPTGVTLGNGGHQEGVRYATCARARLPLKSKTPQ